MPDEKYKLFRQFMTNELGITRADIEEWTKQSVADTVTKLVGHLPIEKWAQAAAEKAVVGAGWEIGKKLREEMAAQLITRIHVEIKAPAQGGSNG